MVQVIKELKGNNEALDDKISDYLGKILTQVIECQVVVLSILQCPNNSKLLEILEQTTGHIYQMSALFISAYSEQLLEIVENDVQICSKL